MNCLPDAFDNFKHGNYFIVKTVFKMHGYASSYVVKLDYKSKRYDNTSPEQLYNMFEPGIATAKFENGKDLRSEDIIMLQYHKETYVQVLGENPLIVKSNINCNIHCPTLKLIE